MKFDLISVIFRLHGLSAVFCNFLKNVKNLEPKTYITILSIPSVISGRNIKGSIFPTLCHIFSISLGPYRESLLKAKLQRFKTGNSNILNQGNKTKILSYVSCFYSKCLAKMKNKHILKLCLPTIKVSGVIRHA